MGSYFEGRMITSFADWHSYIDHCDDKIGVGCKHYAEADGTRIISADINCPALPFLVASAFRLDNTEDVIWDHLIITTSSAKLLLKISDELQEKESEAEEKDAEAEKKRAEELVEDLGTIGEDLLVEEYE